MEWDGAAARNGSVGSPVTADRALRRMELVARALRAWSNSLVNLDGSNRLLKFRDLKVGTLTLPTNSGEPLGRLATGKPIPVAAVFKGVDQDKIADAQRRARTIYTRAKENLEEKGISTARLIAGILNFKTTDGKEYRAPLLLQAVELKPVSGSHAEFQLLIDRDFPVEFNPVLLQFLEHDGHNLDRTALESVVRDASSAMSVVDRAWTVLEPMLRKSEDYSFERCFVVANLAYAALPMVEDLDESLELAAGNDIVAALSGDVDAIPLCLGAGRDADLAAPDRIPPTDEYVILDADSSQNYVLNAVLGGKSLIVQGPPGTGKSQTIANLIATLSARGKTVLFVAEKRAAIDAVVGRLDRTDLGHLVLDIHDASTRKSKIRDQLAAGLSEARRSTPPKEPDRALVPTRKFLVGRQEALHSVRDPWGLSAYEVMSELTALPTGTRVQLTPDQLMAFTPSVREEVAQLIRDNVELSAYSSKYAASGWSTAIVNTSAQAQEALTLSQRISTSDLPTVRNQLGELLAETKLPEPTSLAAWESTFDLIDKVSKAVNTFGPDVFSLDLPLFTAAFASPDWRKENRVKQGWFARRKNKKLIRSKTALPADDGDCFNQLLEAWSVRHQWQSQTGGSDPSVPSGWAEVVGGYQALRSKLLSLGAVVGLSDLDALPYEQAQAKIVELASHTAAAANVPAIRSNTARLRELGLGPLVDGLHATEISADSANEQVQAAILSSLLDMWRIEELGLEHRQSVSLDERAAQFRRIDATHISSTPKRVARNAARHLTEVRSGHPEQDTVLRGEVVKKTRLKPTRELITVASDVLLATKPCWAMSPLTVSQVLPRSQMFDVVIFDEASQVEPAAAIAAILRGRQLVVAGDRHQLPPNRFFAGEADVEDDEDAPETDAYESLIDALVGKIPERSLEWHYRSKDERLIAVSNEQIYGGSLVTFPGASTGDCLEFVHVAESGALTEGDSSTPEVHRVVDIVLHHAEERPEESLGVIAPGSKHAERVEAAVRAAIQERPELVGWFSDDRAEPFFVKNLERVQGDERDAIIITTGYSTRTNGRLSQTFGAINNAGGERRLNVAASRARRRMTLVSSFTSADLDPATASRGRQMFRALFEFAESGGRRMSAGPTGDIDLNPFELQIYDRLVAAGLNVVCQYGVSGYRIDFAVQHPDQPGRFVLAVEADGAQYHSSPTARDRDRLRQEHLERLGWTFHRIWSTAWFSDPDGETQRTLNAYREALNAIDQEPQTGRPAEVESASESLQEEVPRRDRPPFPANRGHPIGDYTDRELQSLARWIRSDGLLYTQEEAVSEMSAHMGFKRKGATIRERLEEAWRVTG